MFSRKRYPFRVTVHMDGRHPYLESHELDYETRDVVLIVAARNWCDAEKVAMNAAAAIPGKWSWSVVKIERGAE